MPDYIVRSDIDSFMKGATNAISLSAVGAESVTGAQAKINTFSSKFDSITVATSVERLDPATYDPDGPVVGVTSVEQADLPNILFILKSSDVTSESSWRKFYYTLDPTGTFIVSMELANVTGTVPNRNVIGESGGVISIGDGITANGRKVLMNSKPDGYLTYTSVSFGGGFTVQHDGSGGASGICYSVNGGAVNFVSGVADVNITVATGLGTGGVPTNISIWPATSASSGRIGNLTYFSGVGIGITQIDLTGLSELVSVFVDDNLLKSIDLSELDSLESLSIDSNPIITIDASNLPSYSYLYARNCPNLVSIIVGNNFFFGNAFSGYIVANNCPLLSSFTSRGSFEGTYYGAYSSGYGISLVNSGMTTDSVFYMLDSFQIAKDGLLQYINLTGSPCDAADGPPPNLTNGSIYTQADIEPILTSKQYALLLTDGTLAP